MISAPRRLVLAASLVGELQLTVSHAPVPGGSVQATADTVQAGGAFRVGAAARRLGLPVLVLGVLSHGRIGAALADAAREAHLDLMVRRVATEQGYRVILAEPDGTSMSVCRPGAEQLLDLLDLRVAEVRDDDAVYLHGADLAAAGPAEAITSWLRQGALGAATLVFAPGDGVCDIGDAVLDTVLSRTDVLVLSKRELALLTGIEGKEHRERAAEAARTMLAPGAHVVVRCDQRGCLHAGEGGATYLPSGSVRTVCDRVANDVHTGVFIAQLAEGHDPATAADRATASWSALGTSSSHSADYGPTRDELAVLVSTRQPWELLSVSLYS